METIHNFPLGLEAFQKRLFALDEVVSLPKAECDTYWPHVDNIWTLKRTNPSAEKWMVYYLC